MVDLNGSPPRVDLDLHSHYWGLFISHEGSQITIQDLLNACKLAVESGTSSQLQAIQSIVELQMKVVSVSVSMRREYTQDIWI